MASGSAASDAGGPNSATASEKDASSAAAPPQQLQPPPPPLPASASTSASKLRSCVLCRRRKVRCDKADPCSNCRRGNIVCVFPSLDRPPRWARRLERLTHDGTLSSQDGSAATSQPNLAQAPHVMERLRTLESLVKELSGQLEQANAAAVSAASDASGPTSSGNSPRSSMAHGTGNSHDAAMSSIAGPTGIHKQFGRMVLKDANQSRYISSGFWSRVDDELHGLKMDLAGDDSDSSDGYPTSGRTRSMQEIDRTPSERHAFLFGHNLGSSRVDSREFHPLPSQIPFLLNTYSENVNIFTQAVHMPTLAKTVRDLRGADASTLPPSKEALLFAVYYAAVTSMEEDDVLNNFGTSKGELNLKFRLGLEHALARADFLNVPDLTVLQAFVVFLALARRHDSPRFVWMMVGLAIRMAQALGLQRDGTNFAHLSPYDVEIRRRVWWTLCMQLDVRASEDQGTEYMIAADSFDTKFPRNINDTDISPDTQETPQERKGLTDMTFPIDIFKICDITRRLMTLSGKQGSPSLEDQDRLLDELGGTLQSNYACYAQADPVISLWVGTTCLHLVVSKMTLIIYTPTLFSTTDQQKSAEIRNKLLKHAIQVAEWNHALNAEQNSRQWRWMYQTYTHWYAVVFMLIEVARRPLSPIVERAWLALHSTWLIPPQPTVHKKLQSWVPLRKLMAKARQHRASEIQRLRGDAHSLQQLELEDGNIPAITSQCPFYSGEEFRKYWLRLFTGPTDSSVHKQDIANFNNEIPGDSMASEPTGADQVKPQSVGLESHYPTSFPHDDLQSNTASDHVLHGPRQLSLPMVNHQYTGYAMEVQKSLPSDANDSSSMDPNSAAQWSGAASFLWTDTDPGADVFADLDLQMDIDNLGDNYWFDWAKDMDSAGTA
ncbi:fungal-specific transcription factor domain-domain-containing protein [Coniella lustricola]|uniref:Fungal-specific transcription factor domain-domain-containing protein n=1 Tax=Coniella lustricola TaxID=2025994 RepID=A0A2T2ZZ38_9PEZI|nr:fungal-specific transcription factor domain-domain-containing protein [Coniella lustricola]